MMKMQKEEAKDSEANLEALPPKENASRGKTSKFIHLHTHSHYSLLDGLSKLGDLVALAKKYQMPALALTDHGNMYGAIEFYKLAKKEGIKPIIGVEAYMTAGSRKDRTVESDGGRRYYHLTLLAKNLEGYKNLIKLVTAANLEGYYYRPRMDKEILRKWNSGILALSGCLGGELSQAVFKNDIEKAEEIIQEYQEIFGTENYFLEIQYHPHIEGDRRVRETLIELGRKHNIPVVATQDSHYPLSGDHEAHRTMLQINTQSDIRDASKFEFSEDDFSFFSTEQALEVFKDSPEAVANTEKVADMCKLELELKKWVFPDVKIEEGMTYDQKLRELTYAGFEKIGVEKTPEVLERVEYELKIIFDKGYSPYFLVVGDLLRFARENGILTAIRGSVAGSMVTYLIGVTNINPIEYKIPFERFLNPFRPSAPDIDMDFADNRRDEMIEYVKKKYGEDRVAQVGTFGTMMARGAVRDVARALGYPYSVGDRLSRMIPLGSQGMPMTIDHAMEMVPELKDAWEREGDTKKIIDLAKKLEGCVRHISVHAAGVVIAPGLLTEYTPLQYDPKGGNKIITQYDMYSLDPDYGGGVGLLKFDFLGIRNLAILSDTISLVRRFYNINIDIEHMPLNDRKTFALLAKGQTEGLFQLNGAGITRFLKELKPTSIHDINAMVALYRPGPMESIPEYIRRKHNRKLVKYLDPRMKKFLGDSYGLIVYQDDLLFCVLEMAGYNWEEADKFRKAVGKKIPAEMAAQYKKFTKGIVENGQTPEFAEKLWKLFEPFQAYGFNKAHAASYGRVAYQTAYMKANYPVEYMTAVLTAESGEVEKIAEIINECKNMKIPVLPPNINESHGGFTVIGHENGSGTPMQEATAGQRKIRFGLYTIKNLGTDIADAIIAERKKNGKYKSIAEFLDRIKHKNLNKKSMEALIKSGSMDELSDRGALLFNLEDMLAYNKESSNQNQNQGSLFGDLANQPDALLPSFKLKDAPPATEQEKLLWEKELLGLYISGHPLDRLRDKLKSRDINIKKIKEAVGNGTPVTIAGIIDTSRTIITKNNERMAFLKISDLSGSIEAVAFPSIFKETSDILVPERCVALSGKVSLRQGEKSIIIEALKVV